MKINIVLYSEYGKNVNIEFVKFLFVLKKKKSNSINLTLLTCRTFYIITHTLKLYEVRILRLVDLS